MPSRSWFAILFCVGLIELSGRAIAATFDVDRSDDEASATACTPAANDCSLRGAILSANAAAGTDTIQLPAGIYVLTIVGTAEEAAAAGDIDITDNLTLDGGDARDTIVDGNDLDRVFEVHEGPTVEIANVTIRNGRADYYGGGILNAGTLTVRSCVLTGNETVGIFGAGGGVASLGDLSIVSSTINDNQADGGGGVANANIGSLVVSNSSTISGNRALGNQPGVSGGGIVSAANITVKDSTIAQNTSIFPGGGLEVPQGSVFTNTMVVGNLPDNCDGGVTSNGYNIDNDGTCHFFATGDQSNVADAGLAPLADNGGETKTHALCTGAGTPSGGCAAASPAIDAGNGCLSTDQRGFARPAGGACDVGAYEAGAQLPPPEPDAFKCYTPRDLRSPKFVPTSVSLTDQFGINDGTFDVMKPSLVCAPVEIDGGTIGNPAGHLLCYRIKGPEIPAASRPQVQTADQLGTLQVEVKKPSMLCVPAQKTLLP
jgi:hypothetical protein